LRSLREITLILNSNLNLVPTPIYLDYNATTPVHPEVLETMLPFFKNTFGNPSSLHSYGSEARMAVEKARSQVAALLGAKPHEIIFTSGGSESNNLAIKGIAHQYRSKGNHIITSQIEHPAVAEVCRYLEQEGLRITWLPVDSHGTIDLEELEKAITPQTILISIMHANNEVGTIQPVKEIAGIAKKHGVIFHTDAAQSAGKISVENLGADLLSIAGHKLYAPKGVGALFIREGIRIEKLIHGADHERDLRAGTENVALVAGLGKACEIAKLDLEKAAAHARRMRDLLYEKVLERVPEVVLNGHPVDRLPNTLSLSFPGVDANLILSEISSEVAASAGAACHAGGTYISATLTAMNVPFETARGTIRFSTGRYTTQDEIMKASEVVSSSYLKLKTQSTIPNLNLNPQTLKLTQFTAGLGCACKLRPQVLEQVLKSLPPVFHPDILVGTESSDDAAVYRINDEQAVVQTLDFFTPIVDDPYEFGAIAAANALSDIYAMGAKPLFALNIVAFPSNRLPLEVLEQILKGASDKAAEAGIFVIGGHTIEDPEPKFGMAVTGIVHPDKILRNKGAKPGDVLILTKPIGTGILATAMKRGLMNAVSGQRSAVGGLEPGTPGTIGTWNPWNMELIQSMLTLNKAAAEVMLSFPISACTDITGFGLLGHLHEMTSASGVDAEIDHKAVPLLQGVTEMAAAGAIPGGTKNNMEYVSDFVEYRDGVPELMKLILNDAQTSGGLLISLKRSDADHYLERLSFAKVQGYQIGRILSAGSGKIEVV
jgi:cysteine desulfurase